MNFMYEPKSWRLERPGFPSVPVICLKITCYSLRCVLNESSFKKKPVQRDFNLFNFLAIIMILSKIAILKQTLEFSVFSGTYSTTLEAIRDN